MGEYQFEGFVSPLKNYFPMPNQWIDVCAEIDNLAELKIVQYVLRHTWGYQEYGIAKTISTDEFMYGRKRQDGSRIDKGTGLKSDRSVKDGIKLAVAHGYLICEVDESDKGRVKKSYMLNMLPSALTEVTLVRGVDSTPLTKGNEGGRIYPPVGSNYPTDRQNLPPRRVDSTPRSEKDTLERHSRKTPKEKQLHIRVSASSTSDISKEVSQPPLIPIESKKSHAQLSEKEQAWFDNVYCQMQHIKVAPKVTETLKGHIATLMKSISTVEQIKSLYEYTRRQKYLKGRAVQAGDLVACLNGWYETQPSVKNDESSQVTDDPYDGLGELPFKHVVESVVQDPDMLETCEQAYPHAAALARAKLQAKLQHVQIA